ncbi:hypothetical protein LTS10_011987 [Elasticomyces elasticus]|nr:hypothetical protein LTS10_011987 [Elasticomyces elasticus]
MLETKKRKKEEYEGIVVLRPVASMSNCGTAKKKAAAAAAAAAAATVPSPSVIGSAAAPVPSPSAAGGAGGAPAPSPSVNVDEPPAKRFRLAIADLLTTPTTEQTRLPSPASARRPGEVDSGEKYIGHVKED